MVKSTALAGVAAIAIAAAVFAAPAVAQGVRQQAPFWIDSGRSAAPAAPAISPTGLPAWYDRRDPMRSLLAELVKRIRQDCLAGDERREIVIGLAARVEANRVFTDEQGSLIVRHLRPAFHGLQNVRFIDLAALDALAEDRRQAAQAQRREMEGSIELIVQASGTRTAEGVQVQLITLPRSLNCTQATDLVPVPEQVVGAQLQDPEAIFEALARELVSRAPPGTNMAERVVVGARGDDGSPVPVTWDDYFARLLRRGVEVEQRRSFIVGDRTVYDIDSLMGRPAAPSPEFWLANVGIRRQANAVRLFVEVRRPGVGSLSEQGTVTPDALPPFDPRQLPRVSLQAVPGGGTVPPARTQAPTGVVQPVAPRPQPDRVDQALGREEAVEITIGEAPQRFQDSVPAGQRRLYAYTLRSRSVVEFDMPNSPRAPEGPAVELLDSNLRPLADVFVGQGRFNLRRATLDPGQYVVAVTHQDGRRDANFTLRFRSADTILTPEPPGRVTRAFGEWSVGEARAPNGQRTCYAFTPALEVAPAGWRQQFPVIWFQISENRNDPIVVRFDTAADYRQGAAIQTQVQGRTGGVETLRVSALGPGLTPVDQGPRGPILSEDAIRAMSRGASMTMSGTSAQGQAVRVEYDLAGYRSAITSMANACGRGDIADRLIWPAQQQASVRRVVR